MKSLRDYLDLLEVAGLTDNDSNDPIYGYLTWVDVLELLEQIKNI